MKYTGTRNASVEVSAPEAVLRGICEDGGLFLPKEIPLFSQQELREMEQLDYSTLCAKILCKFLPEFPEEELLEFASDAYKSFGNNPAPLTVLKSGLSVLELWHGPTCAFKDFALQMLPRLLVSSFKKTGFEKKTAILVATSGDTGKAALEGFRDVPGVCLSVVYPRYGVSETQRLQMITQQGENLQVIGIEGNFDDAQRSVKEIMGSAECLSKANELGYCFSSANSINWGRLAPQIVYYFHAYFTLVRSGRITIGDAVDFCVPSGNFGDILAGYYAKKSGLPVGMLLCASNQNRVLCDFINTGVYDSNRPFHLTSSPSMDILVSSNVERLVCHLCGADETAQKYAQLKQTGRFELTEEKTNLLQEAFSAESVSESEVKQTILRIFEDGYLIDPHTAVGVSAALRKKGSAPMVVLSTASPYKFAESVLAALGQKTGGTAIEDLEQYSGVEAPAQLKGLREREIRFDGCCKPEEIEESVFRFLKEVR